MNSFILFVALGTLFAGYLNIPVAEGSRARLLLESANNNTYKLKPDVLKEISQLQGPIRVIAVVGNARVGKSTTLNLISHIWKGESENPDVEEIFKTGDSFEAVTHDVWAHIIKRPQNVEGSILLLDVEGTDLGDDSVTLHLSMFTAMMSSG
ncbi:hypothetical protein OS493_010923 [Desmophyllum pertusum]|uniref:Guanylate-binding protein N-terminal domain-containing protein n=1 Tax=Desmophyllum pertusum TaxID=174260 RepID=A0A9W9ZEY8_9CNID|nr:hypothetical protein OS493_010923 [Desmophyllum pertusum]